ncbi:MAG: protein phosphatase 2C domain-containing protein [Desulfohalobiaceae bacterium]|nr:protein phosphatase 2C domain-containing protein [Desulfohalobiaceae bacterium]
MRTAVISEQGRRSSMEDRHVLLTDFTGQNRIFGGVYDGHRGSFAAEYAASHLHQRFRDRLQEGQNPEQAFVAAYLAIASELKAEPSGTTAVTFFLGNQTVATANCGDCRAVIIKREKILQLSADHRLDNEEERKRIEEFGGMIAYPYVMSGIQGLMPTRALGDAGFDTAGIIAEPFVRTYSISDEDRFLLAGCDGLFDVLDNEQVGEFAYRADTPRDLVNRLKQEVLENRMGVDNLTIMACELQGA